MDAHDFQTLKQANSTLEQLLAQTKGGLNTVADKFNELDPHHRQSILAGTAGVLGGGLLGGWRGALGGGLAGAAIPQLIEWMRGRWREQAEAQRTQGIRNQLTSDGLSQSEGEFGSTTSPTDYADPVNLRTSRDKEIRDFVVKQEAADYARANTPVDSYRPTLAPELGEVLGGMDASSDLMAPNARDFLPPSKALLQDRANKSLQSDIRSRVAEPPSYSPYSTQDALNELHSLDPMDYANVPPSDAVWDDRFFDRLEQKFPEVYNDPNLLRQFVDATQGKPLHEDPEAFDRLGNFFARAKREEAAMARRKKHLEDIAALRDAAPDPESVQAERWRRGLRDRAPRYDDFTFQGLGQKREPDDIWSRSPPELNK